MILWGESALWSIQLYSQSGSHAQNNSYGRLGANKTKILVRKWSICYFEEFFYLMLISWVQCGGGGSR